MKLKRQFVNLVVESYKSGSFTMHGIKPSSLFHPKNQKGRPLPPTSPVEAELPKPALTLDLSIRKEYGGAFMFMPFGLRQQPGEDRQLRPGWHRLGSRHLPERDLQQAQPQHVAF
jgi:hypothetical protein